MGALDLLLVLLSGTDLTDINDALTVIKNKLNFLVNLTPAERKELRSIAIRRMGYMTGVNDAAQIFGSVIPSSFSVSDFNTQRQLRENLAGIKTGVGSLNELLEDTILLLDDILLTRSDMVMDYFKTGAKGNEALSETVDDLDSIYKRKSPPTAEIVTLAGGATNIVYNVKPGTLFYNKGKGSVKFKAGAELATKVKMMFRYVGPGETVMIPKGWTILEVVNESGTEIAVVSVRKV